MKKSGTVKQCPGCKKFEHSESKSFQQTKLDKKSEIGQVFRGAVSSLFIIVLIVRKVKKWFGFPKLRHRCSVINLLFVELRDVSSKICVNADYSVSTVKSQSFAKKSLLDQQGVSHKLKLKDCLYKSDPSRNLLSESAVGQKGVSAVFDDNCELRCFDKVSFPFVQINGLYVTKACSICSSNFSSTT